MFLTLKRDPVWPYSLSRCSLNVTPALLVGEDGGQVPVPAAILLAASPLVRSISSSGCIHPAVSPIVLSVPTKSGVVLEAVGEIMTKGSWAAKLNMDNNVKIKEVFRLLEIKSVLNSQEFASGVKDEYTSNTIENRKVNVEVKNECAFEIEIDKLGLSGAELGQAQYKIG